MYKEQRRRKEKVYSVRHNLIMLWYNPGAVSYNHTNGRKKSQQAEMSMIDLNCVSK